MKNLLEETLETLAEHNKKPKDVLWCGSADGKFAFVWKTFENNAKGLEYDDGYGSNEIANDLVIVGDGWWLERHDYDGAEWWEYKECPQKAENAKILRGNITLRGDGNIGFERINNGE